MNVDRLIDRLLVAAAAGVCLLSALAAADDRVAFVSPDPVRIEFCSGPESVPVVFASATPDLEPGRQPYPVRSSWWTVNGGYPDRGTMIGHLQSGEHAGRFDSNWLNSLTRDELHSLHSDDHEHRADRLARSAVADRDGSVSKIAKRRQIVVVTAAWCGPCQRWKATEKRRLERAGWTFGDDGHFRSVSSYPGVNSLPSFVLQIDGKAVKTLVGYQTAETLNALYREQR